MDTLNVSSKIIVSDNPVVSHNLAVIRDIKTSPEVFRNSVQRIAQILFSKAFENLPLIERKIQTPLMQTDAKFIDTTAEFIIAPVLRAGLLFSECALNFLPMAKVHHIGLYRDEKTLKPVSYYNNLPESLSDPTNTYVYILDPMLATGGSGAAAVSLFVELGVLQEKITFVSLISAPEGINRLFSGFPFIRLVTGSLDVRLNNYGYILPGLGDAGDRTFNT
jgi:uracil phosphoribosyltransferase